MPDNNRLRANGPFIADVGPSSYIISPLSWVEGIRVAHWHSASALAPLTAPILRHYLGLYDPSANEATVHHSHPFPAAMWDLLCATHITEGEGSLFPLPALYHVGERQSLLIVVAPARRSIRVRVL